MMGISLRKTFLRAYDEDLEFECIILLAEEFLDQFEAQGLVEVVNMIHVLCVPELCYAHPALAFVIVVMQWLKLKVICVFLPSLDLFC